MARQRLSWDKEKTAEIEKKADPYIMNQERVNPPVSKYDIGGPSEFAEDPDLKTPWKTEGRTETGHPAPEREAVMAARKLEDKALKCITIAQRVLPGASDVLIEEQATDFMYLPERAVLGTLQRQAELAEILANGEEEEEKEVAEKPEEEEEKEVAEKPEEEEEKEAGRRREKRRERKKPEEEEEKEAAKKKPEEEEEKEAAKKKPEEEEEKEAAKKKPEEEEEKEAAKKKPEEEEEKEAAEKKEETTPAPEKKEETTPAPEKKEAEEENPDLLDAIFANEEKTGAKKLSGIVKKASTDMTLDNLWDTPPDVSKAFK